MDSYPIFPFYVVIDVSVSMQSYIGALNAELPALQVAVQEDPIVGDIARFGIIAFSDEAEMLLPLSDLLEVSHMPTLQPVGGTNYAAAFELLYQAIPHDVQWFKQHGMQVYRPAVFFISDGQPTVGGWEQWHAALTGPQFPLRPNIVAFGFGQAQEATIARVATFKAYAADRGENPRTVLSHIASELTRSILTSSQRASAGQASLSMPNNIQGMHEIAIDIL